MPPGEFSDHAEVRRVELDAEFELVSGAGCDAQQGAAVREDGCRLAAQLAPLAVTGMHFLTDRQWPGSARAHVDVVAVGPQGVFVIDTKAWSDVSVVGTQIYQAHVDVTDDLLALADLSDAVESELAAVGLAPGEVHVVAVLAGYDEVQVSVGHVEVVGEEALAGYIVDWGRRLTEVQVDLVLRRLLDLFPPVDVPEPSGSGRNQVGATVGRFSLTDEIEQWLAHVERSGALEPWMTFLHPEQAMWVRTSFDGPALITGAAGTGKSVALLHRAAYVARTRQVRVVVTGYVRQMPSSWDVQMLRLAPDVAHQVDIASVYQLALAVLRARGVALNINKDTTARSFEAAWATVNGRSVLRDRGLGKSYWLDEIAHVIKGRALTSFEEYAAISREGRGHRLNLNQRYEMWSLYEQYAVGLRRYKAHDWADVILLAERELRERSWGSVVGDVDSLGARYGAVMVDEAHNLSSAMVRMLCALAGDTPDALVLCADPRQAVSVGRFALDEAGVDVRGREVELVVNHRATMQIARYAEAWVGPLLGSGEVVARATLLAGSDAVNPAGRQGPEPEISRHASRQEHDRALVGRVFAATSEPSMGLRDVTVLAAESRTCHRVMTALAAAGVPVVDMGDDPSHAVDAVAVGTIKRAKGVESRLVLLADVRPSDLEPASAEQRGEAVDGVARERWESERREMYVAMTRARDALWLGVVGAVEH